MQNFVRNEDGQGMVEYALVLALVAIVVIVALTAVGNAAKGKMESVNSSLQ